MSTLEVLEAGPYTSVQDRGRFGGQRYGLGPAGAMDLMALAKANVLVGQPANAAAIEIGPLPARFRARSGAIRLALSGALRGMHIAGRDVTSDETVVLAEGEVLTLRASRERVFSYLALEGGIQAPPVFGSLSVHARSGIGSPFARALQAGDCLDVGAATSWDAERSIHAERLKNDPIRVVLGPQNDHFTQESIADLLSADWSISPTSDRMGYRLEGPVLRHAKGHNIISDGIAHGSIQVPGNGQPLVLLADRGTTGGYPKVATIISADLGRMAQTPAGSKVKFASISIVDAQVEARRMAQRMADLAKTVRDVGGGALSAEFLLGANLAGSAFNALE